MPDTRSERAVAKYAASSTGDPSELVDGGLKSSSRSRQHFWGSCGLCNGGGGGVFIAGRFLLGGSF